MDTVTDYFNSTCRPGTAINLVNIGNSFISK